MSDTTRRTVHGLVIERSGDRLTLREPAVGRNTVMTAAIALTGVGFIALGLLAAQGFATIAAVVVGVGLGAVGAAGLVSHARGDGVVTVDLAAGSVERTGQVVGPVADERPGVAIVHEIRHRPDPNGISRTPRSSWQVEIVLGDRRWGLQPSHRSRVDASVVARAVQSHVGGEIGRRDTSDADAAQPDE